MQPKFDKNLLPIAFDLDKEYLFEQALKRPRKNKLVFILSLEIIKLKFQYIFISK